MSGRWDLGIEGVGLLAAPALGFGLIAHLIAGKGVTRRLGLLSAIACSGAALAVGRVGFGGASEEELQPDVDGLAFDEVHPVLLAGLGAALIAR